MSRLPNLLVLALAAILPFSSVFAAEVERPISLTPEGPQAIEPLKTPDVSIIPQAITAPTIEALGIKAIPQAAQDGLLPQAAAQTPAQTAAKMTEAVTAQAQAGLDKAATSGDSRTAAANIQTIIEGRPAASANSSVVEASAGNAGPTAAAPLPKAEPVKPQAPAAPPAVKKAEPKAVDSVVSYELRRRFLSYLSRRWGIELSLPRGGEKVDDHVLAQAANGKRAIISDYDDTIAKYRENPSAGVAAAMKKVRQAGKLMIVNSERPAMPGQKSLSVAESLSSMAPEDRVGIFGAGKSDGKIFEFQADGTPKVIFTEPSFSPEEQAKMGEAVAALKAKMPSFGAEMHDGSQNIPAEGHSAYSMSLMLKIGTPEAVLLQARDELQDELKARGLPYEVEARFAKSASNPPYIMFSRMDKSWPLEPITETFKLKAKDVVVIGDAMYYPKEKTYTGIKGVIARVLTRIGLRLNGGIPLGKTGNATDRDMERRVAGALTVAVGGSASPTLRQGYVTSVTGPSQTQRVFEAVADDRAPAKPPRPVDSRVSYGARRLALSALASVYGAVGSLPVAGPRLQGALFNEVEYKQALFSDYDHTLADNSKPLSAEMAADLVAVRRAGKNVAILTERPTTDRQAVAVSVLDSLEPIPAADRAGIVVASRRDANILEYDAQGVPQVIYQEPGFNDAERRGIEEATQTLLAKMGRLGVGLKFTDVMPHFASVVLAAGTPEQKVVELGRLYQEALNARGLKYEVQSRMARNPKQEPYLSFFKIDKASLVQRIARRWRVEPEGALLLGDNFYIPSNRGSSRARALAERISGRAIPATGNGTDRDLERGLPGALALSVSDSADPTMSNAYVVGPDGASKAVKAMSLRKAGEQPLSRTFRDVGMGVLIIAMAVLAWGTFIYAMTRPVTGPVDPQQYQGPPVDINQLFGGR